MAMPSELWSALRGRTRATAVYLLSDPDVTLVDIGWKIKEREGRRITNDLVVRVHRKRKPRGAEFEAFATKYPERVVTEERVGFPIDVIEADYPLQWWYPPLPSARNTVQDPLVGGLSVSKLWGYSYGTLGGIVQDRDTGDPLILSNWHVLGGSFYAAPDLKICQPACAFGAGRRHVVAVLERDGMHEGIDAAVARLTGSREWLNEQLEVGRVTGAAQPELDAHLVKSGCGSAVTEGIVTGIEGVRKFWYAGLPRTIRHILHIAPAPGSSQVSAGGDSGSWWLEIGTGHAVGLHFAGSDDPEYGLAMAMPAVLEALHVNIPEEAVPERALKSRSMAYV